ncbi:unnamed protein product [Amaranthus hypochondriacus]
MAEEDQNPLPDTLIPSIPVGRVKKIVKIDKEITRISSEALFLISGATELFLRFLGEESAKIAAEKKRKTIKLDYLRMAVNRHQATRDFLLDSLPIPSQPSDHPPVDPTVKKKHVLAPNSHRIESFFTKTPKTDALRNEDPDGEDKS